MRAKDMERVPLDIHTKIIDHLETLSCGWPTKRKCLENLSLTCRDLRPLCQRSLFRKVTINFKKDVHSRHRIQDGRSRMLDFLELANNSPVPLANYIRDLRFVFGFLPILENLVVAPQFLSRLQNINIFHLTGYFCRSYHGAQALFFETLDWLSLEKPLADAFSKIINSPRLQSLHLEGFNKFPTQILISLKKSRFMNDVSIGYMQIDQERPQTDALNQTSKYPCPKILRYRLNTFCRPISSLFQGGKGDYNPVFDFTQLQHLSVEWYEQSDVEETKALMCSAHKIEILRCESTNFLHARFNSLNF